MTEEAIRNTFRYHSPGPIRVKVHEEIRDHHRSGREGGGIDPATRTALFITRAGADDGERRTAIHPAEPRTIAVHHPVSAGADDSGFMACPMG